MAKDKTSFILYTDLIHTVEKMTDKKAGELLKHILKYVNDKDPDTSDMIIQLVFEPIKQQLKRDLVNWENIREKRSIAGKASAESRKQKATKLTHVESVEQTPTKSTVTVNDTVIVNVNDIKNRKLKFSENINKFTDYSKKTLTDFFDYWSESNKSNTKMKFELQRTWDLNLRLKRWNKNDFNKTEKKPHHIDKDIQNDPNRMVWPDTNN